jgi:MFS family permease
VSWWQGLRRLARQPLWRRWTLASLLARLPTTMTLLGLVLVGQEVTGSLAVGAQLAGVATFTSGLAAPWRGRRLDRFELRGGLQRAGLATAAVVAVQAGALVLGAPVWVFFALAVVQGIAMAALSGGYRALLVPVVPAADLPRANVIEAVFVEVAFVAGPALAGILSLVVGPLGVLVAMSLSAGMSAVVARRLPDLPPARERPPLAPWRVRSARPVYALALALGISLGMFEAALPARAEDFGVAAGTAGVLLALTAAGSGLGGLLVSGHDNHLTHPARRAALLLAAFAALMVPAGLAPSVLWIALALFAVGMPIAPLNALGALMLQQEVPPGRQAEGFAVYVAAIVLGAGTGNGVTGAFLDQVGAQVLLVAAAVPPALMALVLVPWALRRAPARERAVAAAHRAP